MKTKLFYSLLLIAFVQFALFAQDKKTTKDSSDNITMTWNKNTPESEMKDDIKALAEHGVTISYSDVKRNKDGEITAIKVTYSDKNGNNGNLSLNNQKPINTIKFYKYDDEVGFGEPSDSNFMGGDFAYGFNPNNMMENFGWNGNGTQLPGQQFHFDFPNGNSNGQSSSKMIIKEDGKKPLVIQDGQVVEGGDDYTKEELEEIIKNNKVESVTGEGIGNLDEQMKKMQAQLDEMMSKQQITKSDKKPKTDLESTTDEMKKATEEMKKAKAEFENAKKELQKAQSSLKTQKT